MKIMVRKVPITAAEYRAYHVNRVKDEYPALRNESKRCTFALQYAGTPITLVKNAGFSPEEASQIHRNYHKAYTESKQYSDAKKQQACQDGYLTVAFGLRIRTPLLQQVIWGSKSMPKEAEAEARTVGNALSQSYGLLNNRASVDFFKKVWASKYRYDILPCAQIHDASYLIMKDDIEVVEWANRELTASMAWQDLPELAHPEVKITAALDIFWPDWSNPITLPINADQEAILATCKAGQQAYLEEQAKKLQQAA